MVSFVDTPLASRIPRPGPRQAAWNPALAGAILPGAEAAQARLSEPEALVVTTGQQPGLFGGPLYTLHKALSARALAFELERQWRRPVVPVFWLAGDDHDYAEGASTAWLGADGGLVHASLDPRPPDAPMVPLAREPVPPRVNDLIADLATALPDSPARSATIDWLRRHYRTGQTLAGAFGGAMAELLGPLGIVCFDATSPAAKAAAAPVLLRALDQARDLDQILAGRAAELDTVGEGAGVRVGDGAALVFLEGDDGRDRLVIGGDGFVTRRGGRQVAAAELARIGAEAPERLSPNVLLRPVVESAILPTVAYLAGPGELRYLRLAEALYRPMGVSRQAPVPRWSGIVVERRVARALEKFGISLDQLRGPAAPLEQQILTALAPADFEAAFADLRTALDAGFARLTAVALAIDPTFEQPTHRSHRGALGTVAELEKRLLQAQKRRQGEQVGQLVRARTAVLPDEKPQERVLGVPALTGRYGFSLVTDLATHIADWYQSALEADPPPA